MAFLWTLSSGRAPGSRGRCGSSPAPRATRSSSRARPVRTGSRAAR
jgi:hypothetical protein